MKKLFYLTSGIISLLSNTTFAYYVDPHEVFDQVNNSFSASLTVMRFDYREYPDYTGPVDIYGYAFGPAIDFRNVFFTKIYADLAAEFTAGKLQYDGYYQKSLKPLKYKEIHDFLNTDLKDT